AGPARHAGCDARAALAALIDHTAFHPFFPLRRPTRRPPSPSTRSIRMGSSDKQVTASPLFQPFQLGPIQLANRMVLAPLTRSRAEAGNVPGEMTIEYYAQRASVGLIIAEATQVSAQAQGYIATPGLH